MTFSQTANAMNNVTIKQAHDAARLLWGAISSEDEKYDDALNLLQYFINQNPTPVQGEALPVVAYIDDDEHTLPAYMVEIDAIVQKVDLSQFRHKLTYHAQATAEIARLQAKFEEERTAWCVAHTELMQQSAELATLRTQLSNATGQVAEYQEKFRVTMMAWEISQVRLEEATGQVGKLREALDNAEQAFVRIEMQLGHRLINGEMHEAPAGSMGELSEIATDALYDLRAALNSTALDTPHTQG
jgi:hypothetical protein